MPSSSPSCELSVLIPARDEGDHLRRTVERVRATIPPESEVIVVDDGSKDGCADFLRDRVDLALLIQPDQRLGVAGARNRAAALANGEVLVFLDAHVDPHHGWSEALLDVLRDDDVGAAAPGIAVLGREANRGYGLRWRGADLRVEWLPAPSGETAPVPLLPGACIAVRRDVFLASGGFDRAMFPWRGGRRVQPAPVAAGLRAADRAGGHRGAPVPRAPSLPGRERSNRAQPVARRVRALRTAAPDARHLRAAIARLLCRRSRAIARERRLPPTRFRRAPRAARRRRLLRRFGEIH